ncbi:hypothetical protein FRC02_006871 [Tulasnella sp. 418]|nr:hypothetical protein FRC02_006871 [Tulasnella sp. 418]
MSSVLTDDRYYEDILRQHYHQQEAMSVSRSLGFVSGSGVGASELQRVPRYNLHHHDSLDRLHHFHRQQPQLSPYLLDMFHQQHVPIAPHPLIHAQQHQPVRKRPKYSRSKLGCLSCRVRKVKCDEAHPVCTRCAHSQRECTWPVDPPRSKKQQQQQQHSDSAESSRPSTASASDSGAGPSQDAGWVSDTGAAGGAIRRVPSAHDRIANHARIPSISRGRDIQSTSSLSRSRDQSPNPFAYNVAHLPQHNHHRSASTSSTASTSSSSLPYPLVPASITTTIPGLSSSRNSSPASTHFAQSPTGPWHPASEQRPGTAGGGLSAGFGGMDLNGQTSSSPFATASFDPNTGFPNQGFMTSGGAFDASPLDVNFAFGGSAQSFDGLSNSFNSGVVDSNGNPYESLPTQSADLDHSTNFLLNQSIETNNVSPYAAYNPPSASSDGSEVDSQMDSLDPRALSSNSAASATNPIPLAQPQPSTFHQSGFGGPNPLPTSRFGSNPQASGTTPTPTSPIYGNPLTGFGTNLDLQQHQHLQQQGTLAQQGYGATISTTPHSMGMYPQLMNNITNRPHFILTGNSLPTPKTRSSSLEYGSTSERTTLPQLQTSFSENTQLTTNNPYSAVAGELGAGVELGFPPELVCSPSQIGQDTSRVATEVEQLERLPTEAGQGAALYMAGAPVGVQVVENSSSPLSIPQMAAENGLPMTQGMELSGEDEMGLSRSKTPTNMPIYLSPQQQSSPNHYPLQQDHSFSLLQSPLSPSSVQTMEKHRHARNRSDTVTPFTVNGMYGEDSTSDQVVDLSNETQWGNDGLAGLAGIVGSQVWPGRNGASGERSMVVRNNPDPIEPFFKSVQERNLIRHYCQNSTHFNMALPSSLNPILSVHLPIVLSNYVSNPTTPSPPTSPESLPTSPASSSSSMAMMKVDTRLRVLRSPIHASIEALRLSLLGVAAMHQSYMLAKSGPENAARAREMWNLASELRVMSSTCLGEAVKSLDGCRSDASLGACVSIALIDIFAGGHKYQSNLALAKTLVTVRGGPAAIVNSSSASVEGSPDMESMASLPPAFEGPFHFVEGSSAETQDTKKGLLISTGRLLLEILAVYELFSTLTSGEEPTLLHPSNSLWWFEGDKSNYHLFSVEKVFGMSRSIVEVFSRVLTFLNRNRYRPTRAYGTLQSQGNPTPVSSRPSTPSLSLSALTVLPPPPESPLAPLHQEASSLLLELESGNGIAIPTAIHPRVEYGNEAHRHAMIILLLREAFNIPASDPRVQKSAEQILRVCGAAVDRFGMGVDLTWPVIIAGCQVSLARYRSMTATILAAFRKQCCFEIDTSQQIITEVWKRMDNSLPGADFRSVIDDFNLRVLIL